MNFEEIETKAKQEVHERLERIKKSIEEEHRRQDIICPYCNRVQDNESKHGHVTYWGEEGEFETDCESCNKKFICEEEVRRQFHCKKWEDKE